MEGSFKLSENALWILFMSNWGVMDDWMDRVMVQALLDVNFHWVLIYSQSVEQRPIRIAKWLIIKCQIDNFPILKILTHERITIHFSAYRRMTKFIRERVWRYRLQLSLNFCNNPISLTLWFIALRNFKQISKKYLVLKNIVFRLQIPLNERDF